mmetsp:Transcript_51639/g.109725  ORF Transcript_51639/g.109725 Transcript_51639/m.109725 type:complete len:247 (+) Transcript_51639:95-835(+)
MDAEAGLIGQARTWRALGQTVPHQAQQILISWIFIVASATLLLDFISLQVLTAEIVAKESSQSYFAKLCNWFGVVSCLSWLLGFAILIHWLTRISATKGSLAGAWLKLIASVLFNLQPMTGVAGTAAGAGIWWSNLVGILFFHVGNLVSCADMWAYPAPGVDFQKKFFAHGNLAVIGMWFYQIATWFLVAANLLACNWNGASPPDSWLETGDPVVQTCQYLGGCFLVAGSFIYLAWSDGFRTCAAR